MLDFARITSFLLGPMFTLFPILFILVAKFSNDYSHALEWTIFSYIFVFAVAIFIIVGVITGYFSNFNVSKREERPLLFSFISFISLCYFISLLIFDGPKILIVGFFALVFGMLVISITNRKIKASMHVMTATAACLLIGLAYKGFFFLFLVLIPLLAWARIKTKEHTFKETIAGCILGIVLTLIIYIAVKHFFLEFIHN